MESIQERIAERIRNSDEFRKAENCFVSIYNKDRCFGGPEEGGWWYDVYTLEGGKPFSTRQAAEDYLKIAEEEIKAENQRTQPDRNRATANLPDEEASGYPEGYIPTGWSDGGDLLILIENNLGAMDNSNEPPPHYC